MPLTSSSAADWTYGDYKAGLSGTPSERLCAASCVLALIGADCFAFLGSGLLLFLSAAARHSAPSMAAWRLAAESIVVFVAVVAYLAAKRRYSGRVAFWTETWQLTCASLCALGAVALAPLTGNAPMAEGVIGTFALFPALAMIGNRLAKSLLQRVGLWAMPVVIVGDGPAAAAAAAALLSDRALGYRIVAWVNPATAMQAPAGSRWRPVLARFRARRLVLALDDEAGDQRRPILESMLHERAPFATLPQSHGLSAFTWHESRFFSHHVVLLSFRDRVSNPAARAMKLALDISLATIILVLVAPLLAAIALITRLDGGPALFAHPRIGVGGRPFNCLKFRTMVVDADQVLQKALARDPGLAAEWSATRKLRDDPRITRLGRFLRATSLDELPQLLNVLRLEMSLVGPRPIVESEVALYGADIAHYYAARPGITGLWQVSGRSNTSYMRRVQLDVWYVNNWSIWHDVAVLLKTIPTVLTRHGAC